MPDHLDPAEAEGVARSPLLEQTTHSVSAYPKCLEAVVQLRRERVDDRRRTAGGMLVLDGMAIATAAANRAARGSSANRERSERSAAARAKTAVRRIVLQNLLDHLWTFTLAPEWATHSEDVIRARIEDFRRAIGTEYGCWLTVIEPHPGGHGWHVHAAVHGFVPIDAVRAAWPFGHVLVRYRGPNARQGSTSRTRGKLSKSSQCRRLAGYLSKYLVKEWDQAGAGTEGSPEGPEAPDRPVMGLNRKRYSCTRGFAPQCVRETFDNSESVLLYLEQMMGGPVETVWSSVGSTDWEGPPTWLVVLRE